MRPLNSFLFRLMGRLNPAWVYRRYSRLSRLQGLNRLYLILSFDCDTPEDIPAAEQVHTHLKGLGVKTTFAVPGQILELGAETFRRLSHDGADFINHGAMPHAEWRDGRYWSVTFYNEMSPEAVWEDIRCGHEILERVIGRAPTGFRAPHFGLLQDPQDLAILHAASRELGYRFSTSTPPSAAFQFGPTWKINGIFEIPVSGSYTHPLTILDSWSQVVSPQKPMLQDKYASLLKHTVDKLLEQDLSGVLNYYIDPAHVYKNEVFLSAISYAVERGIVSLQYGELLDKLGLP